MIGCVFIDYIKHTLFSLILGGLLFYNPFLVLCCVIGANLPDMDHAYYRKVNIYYSVFCLFLLVFLCLVHLAYVGIAWLGLSLLYLTARHRKITHSIVGLFLQVLLFILLFLSFEILIKSYNHTGIHSIFIFLLIFSIFYMKKPVLILNLILLIFSLHLHVNTTLILMIIALSAGLFSHLILDSFTPRKIQPLYPFSKIRIGKNFGIFSICFLAIVSIVSTYAFIIHYII